MHWVTDRIQMAGMLNLVEDETFYFDEAAAKRAIGFIETFCTHYREPYVGQPFLLTDLQKQIVGDVYGWKYRGTEIRRFNEMYWEGAVGAGKSPVLAGIGLVGVAGDKQAAAEVYSLANTYSQAKVVFETAKQFIEINPKLARALVVRQFHIYHPASKSVWQIVSKKVGAGRQPTMVLGDEVHEWTDRRGYDALFSRMAKRGHSKQQPLMALATNAAESQATFCWQKRQAAMAALQGRGNPRLYVVIWAAIVDQSDPEAVKAIKTDDREAWKRANPLMGITIKEEDVANMCREAMKSEEEEAEFRRLYLGIWPTVGAGAWLDLSLWDACSKPIAPPTTSSLYVGLDLSLIDDMCAAVYVWPQPDFMELEAEFWIPEVTAKMYEQKFSIPFSAWAKAGHINLLKERTITKAVRQRIAARIVERSQGFKLEAVCYDQYKADDAIDYLQNKRITCVPMPQAAGISRGNSEIERRLKDDTLRIRANDVLRYCAENATADTDRYGNVVVTKPKAKGKYAGDRKKKIDGISAAASAITEARKWYFMRPGPMMPSTVKIRG